VAAIDATKSILGDLRNFSKREWVVRYPQLHQRSDSDSRDLPTTPSRVNRLRRSLSFADDPNAQTDVVFSRQGLKRSNLVPFADAKNEDTQEQMTAEPDLTPSSDFHVLRLDLKLGPHGSSASASSLVTQLEKSSIAHLLDEQIGVAINHIEKLRLRVEDTSSKVLVTGDLNAGKSTFVNALLRREVMPVDQQPCTTAFCEVHDAAENDGKEEIHVLKDGLAYNIQDGSTFLRKDLSALEHIVGDNESHRQMLKLYLADTRAPSESLLNNGVVDISLIDAPGLNRDSFQTTALFARQEEIDVVVFVVSAENHFTLSAKDFLSIASREKAYLFIVVNKFDQIKNKDKCRRLVLEQIEQLSPRTYQDAADLVHFVDSASALQPFTANPAFDDLESSLRSFVLVKRSKSKLHPVSTYLSHLLSDVDFLAKTNAFVSQAELERAICDLERARPILTKMKNGQETFELTLESIEEEGAGSASTKTKASLANALERVGKGQLGIDASGVSLPTYPGLLGVWSYARDVRKALLTSLDMAVKLAEDEARVVTGAGVNKISELGDNSLPEGVERSKRVFIPEAMFRTWKKGGKPSKHRRLSSSSLTTSSSGVHGLGIGLAHRTDLLETTFFDLFDVRHHLWVHFGSDKDKEAGEDEDSLPSALSVVSVGLGALTMVGGQAVGMRALIEGIVRLTDLFGNETARKWAAPVIGAFTIGLTAYLVLELPSTIPRTVGRRIRGSLVKQKDGDELGSVSYVDGHAERISRETRKVLRLASWDQREKFRGAMEERGKEVRGAEEMEKKAGRAYEWFVEVQERTGDVRMAAKLGSENLL
jgi:mitofusin